MDAYADATVTPDRFRRYAIPASELHRLKATNDQARFFTRDAIASAEDAGSKPGKQVGASKSVKDCRLSARSKLTIRSTNNVGITGGHVDGATDPDVNWGREDVLARRRKPGSRRTRKLTAKQIRAGR